MCARRRSGFLLRRQKKVTKEKATPLSASPALRAGATCGARERGASQNSLRAFGAPFRQLRRARPRSMCVLRHTCHPARCAPRRIQRGWGENIPSGHCFAALRSAPNAQALRAATARPSEAMARVAVRLFGCSAIPPLLAAPATGRLRGEHGRKCAHASLTDSPQLFERSAPARSEFCGAPRNRPDAGRPAAKRRGRRLGVAFSLVTFFWRRKRKLLACRATPGLRPQHRRAAQSASSRAAPRFRQAQPERIPAKFRNYKNNS